MLTIERLTKTYKGSKKPALDSVGFSISKGEFVALLGPNGAGKSTLIDILSGRVDADSGGILIDGRRLTRGASALRAFIGTVPQEIRFDYVFTVEEILRLETGFYGLPRDDKHIGFLMDRLTLLDKKKEKVRSLSGGMKRRLMIARALVHKPRLLLLDEPTAGVDLNLRQDMYAFLRELSEGGTTIILTTHYLEEAEKLCNRIILLDKGRLIADKSREDFLKINGDMLYVEIKTGSEEKIRGIFHANGAISSKHDGDSLTFVFQEADRYALLESIRTATGHIESLQIRKPRLEEIFASLTKKEESLNAIYN